MNTPTPTRHGNWHIVEGRLVDRDAEPAPAETSAAPTASASPADAVPPTTVVASIPPRRSTPSKE